MSPRDYHEDRAATDAERQRRYRERHSPKPSSLARIDEAPPTRQQMFARAALQPRPEQFTDTWGEKGRLTKQHEREDVDWGRQYDGYGPDLAVNIYVPTRRSYTNKGLTKKLLFKDGKLRSVPVARAASPVRLIPVTPELEQKALADLARCARRKRRKR